MTTATIENHVAVRQLREAQAQVEKIKNDAAQMFPEAASIGDAVRQGDIYIQLIEPLSGPPMFYTNATPSFPMQLADGNTKGSRHCLEHGRGVTVYTPVDSDSAELNAQIAAQYGISTKTPEWRVALSEAERLMRKNLMPGQSNPTLYAHEAEAMLEFAGPIFTLTETNTVTHPEHGDWILPPGTYRVTYQRTVTKENIVTRVLD